MIVQAIAVIMYYRNMLVAMAKCNACTYTTNHSSHKPITNNSKPCTITITKY